MVDGITAAVIVSCAEGNGELWKNLIKDIQAFYFRKNISGNKVRGVLKGMGL